MTLGFGMRLFLESRADGGEVSSMSGWDLCWLGAGADGGFVNLVRLVHAYSAPMICSSARLVLKLS